MSGQKRKSQEQKLIPIFKNLKEMNISISEATITKEDAKIVMEWRNNSETLKMFYNQKVKTWDTFWKEYSDEYFKSINLTPCFALLEGRKIAFLRSLKYDIPELSGISFDIDINVSPDMRGKGIGTSVIKVFCNQIFSNGVDHVIAEVKKINLASARAFEKSDFVLFDVLNLSDMMD